MVKYIIYDKNQLRRGSLKLSDDYCYITTGFGQGSDLLKEFKTHIQTFLDEKGLMLISPIKCEKGTKLRKNNNRCAKGFKVYRRRKKCVFPKTVEFELIGEDE